MIDHLVLDVGGVLATNLSPTFWETIARELQFPKEPLYEQYKVEISTKLWTGAINIEQFWNWFEQFGATISEEARQRAIATSLLPLPSLQYIGEWSAAASIHIMSNHRTEWLQPILNKYLPYFTSVHISDKVGFKKPDLQFFQHVQQQFKPNEHILFVDDTSRNLLAAESLGWQTLRGDESGHWTAAVSDRLQ